MLSSVEARALQISAFKDRYPPAEKIRAIVAANFPAMGQLTALRFLEWAQQNPEGAMSLPTGKTPEHFIRWVTHIINNWDKPEVRALADEYGLAPRRPDLRGLRFVQIDEFYPMPASQRNSFAWYVREFYLKGFGLDPARAQLIDCEQIGLGPGEKLGDYWPEMRVDLSLRHRQPQNALEQKQATLIRRVDQWCGESEQRIRDGGGLGFFLGGIGPDGHIGFNMRGSDHFSTTRLTVTNYETQAASASDLGGVEIAANRLVITIGLGTITCNPECVAVIMAAGEAKAPMVRDAVENAPDVRYPATSLQKLPNACFYVTQGAAKLLGARQLAAVEALDKVPQETVEKALIDLSAKTGKRLADLATADVAADPFATAALRGGNLEQAKDAVIRALVARIEKGMQAPSDKTFLHTEPHHDDIMLGYLAGVVRAIRPACNRHHFATMTSGFTSVTTPYLRRLLRQLEAWLDDPLSDAAEYLRDPAYFAPGNRAARNRDVWGYLDGIASRDPAIQRSGASRRLLRNLTEVYGEMTPAGLRERVRAIHAYLDGTYPGQKDPADIQKLKGMCREWESECLWGYFGWNTENIHHLRLGFYSGDIFTREPEANSDVPPIVQLLKEVRPDVVSLAFDPEGSGPDTHYKVMQAVTAALASYAAASPDKEVKVWGYRNVWYRFHPSEANIYVPVSLNMFAVLENSFLNTFISQKEASFPSFEFDGPFCGLAQKIQVEQYHALARCLGRDWFYGHPSPLIRATRGFVFLNEMTLEELSGHCRRLRKAQEELV